MRGARIRDLGLGIWNLKNLGKKGAGHFEMIAGFTFFVGFTFFLFMYISPWGSSSLPDSALEGLYATFHENVDVPLSSVLIKTNYTGEGDCFYISLPNELFNKQIIANERTYATKLGGEEVDSSLRGENLNLEKGESFFRVAISPEFNEGSLLCSNVNDNFELGGVVELDVVSYSRLTEMRDEYFNDYEGLKKKLKVANIFDFAIIPEDMEEALMEPDGGIPDNIDVLARDYVVKVLKSDGSVSNERINFRIW